MICLLIIIIGLRWLLAAFGRQAGVRPEKYSKLGSEEPRNEKIKKKRKNRIVLLNTLFKLSGYENIVYYSYTKRTKRGHHAQNLSIRRFKSGTWGSKMTQKKALKISLSGSNLAPQVQIWHLRFKFGTTL